MRKRRLLGPLALLFFVAACGDRLSSEELAALAAEGYYRHLVAGEYEKFLECRVGADSLPDSYREQLLTGYKQFMAQQQRAHHGIRDVRVSSVRTDSLSLSTTDRSSSSVTDNSSSSVTVFLLLTFGDSLREEIAVPMVNYRGRWCLR